MFGKLLKYEIKSISRSLLPLYAAVLAASVANGIMGMGFFQNLIRYNAFLGGIPYVITNFLYFGLNVAVFVVTLLIIIQRFYRGLLCDEGYLMFTLPVTAPQLVLSKLLVAGVMSIISCAVSFLSMMILAAFYGGLQLPSLSDLAYGFGQLGTVMPTWPLATLEFFVALLLGLLGTVCMLYAAMAIGHLGRRHRVALSFAAYIGLNIAFQTISSVLLSLLDWIGPGLSVFFMPSNEASLHLLMVLWILYNLVSLAAWFIITNVILSRRLNLE